MAVHCREGMAVRRFRIMHHLHVGMMLLLLLFIIVPFFPLLLFAFSSRLPWPNLLPETWSFRAWEYVLSPTSGTWSAVATSMLIAIVVTVINLIGRDSCSRCTIKISLSREGMGGDHLICTDCHPSLRLSNGFAFGFDSSRINGDDDGRCTRTYPAFPSLYAPSVDDKL